MLKHHELPGFCRAHFECMEDYAFQNCSKPKFRNAHFSNCVFGKFEFLFFVFPQTGLALMGFSRYCPSSLDLLHFVLRERRGATAEPQQRMRWILLRLLHLEIWKSRNLEIQESGNLELQESGSLGIWNPKNQKHMSECRSVLPKMSVRSGLVGENSSLPHLRPFQANLFMGRQTSKTYIFFLRFSLVVQ